MIANVVTDAARHHENGISGWAAVIREGHREVVRASGAMSAPTTSIREAEARAAIRGLKLANARGYRLARLVSDDKALVRPGSHYGVLVRASVPDMLVDFRKVKAHSRPTRGEASDRRDNRWCDRAARKAMKQAVRARIK